MTQSDWWTADAATRQTIGSALLEGLRVRLDASAPGVEVFMEALLQVAATLGFTGVALWQPTGDGKLENRGFAAVTEMAMFEKQSREMLFPPGKGR